jgi:hypothetical protein
MADSISWISPDGLEYSISDNHLIKAGSDGLYMPPIDFVEEDVALQHGSRLREVLVRPREIDLPIYVDGTNEVDLRNQLRMLIRLLNPLKGDGKLRVKGPDGSQRELVCRYKGGLEISEKSDSKIGNLQGVVLVLRAFDPFWYDTTTQVHTFTTGQPATFFPFFPMRLSSSTVFADTTVENTGDVEAWPEWIITGPGDTIILRNLTTGEVTQLNVDLGRGESITIDTRPFHKTITRNNGINDFNTLTDDSSLWALQEGINNIRLEMSNATSESSIQLSYKNRYWGP